MDRRHNVAKHGAVGRRSRGGVDWANMMGVVDQPLGLRTSSGSQVVVLHKEIHSSNHLENPPSLVAPHGHASLDAG